MFWFQYKQTKLWLWQLLRNLEDILKHDWVILREKNNRMSNFSGNYRNFFFPDRSLLQVVLYEDRTVQRNKTQITFTLTHLPA